MSSPSISEATQPDHLQEHEAGRLLMPHVLREYALLADGQRGALIGPRGDIAWMCFPGWSDPAVFASLLGGRGVYAITPCGRHVWGGSYEPGTLIWRSRWVTASAIIECREALAYPGAGEEAVILRRLQVMDGEACVELTCAVAGDYGRARAEDLRCEDGTWRGRTPEGAFSWSGAATARPDADGTLRLTLECRRGDTHDFVLTIGSDRAIDSAGPAGAASGIGSARGAVDPERAWAETEMAWRRAVPRIPLAVAERDANHARAVLRGMTAPSGGMVAAATMSLPERAEQGRAFDYRYAWVRDQAIVGQAAATAGDTALLDSATSFLTARLLEHGPRLAPAYTVAGRAIPDERSLGLEGYPGGEDIAGNHAGEQFQLDAFGESLLCLAAAAGEDRLDADGWRAIETAAGAVAARRGEPDAGIWELDPDHWTHSRLICAAGLRRAAAFPIARGHAGEWLALADRLLADASTAIHPSGRWQRSPADARLDAALLFAQLRGATTASDPRAVLTLAAVERELTDEFFAYRYRPDERPLGEAEGAFLLCGFTIALALEQVGRHVAAAHWFERNRGACGPPGLLSEEFDVAQRQLRGNLPQAFVHALLLECAVTLPGAEIDREMIPEGLAGGGR